jgi:hypothetical protein
MTSMRGSGFESRKALTKDDLSKSLTKIHISFDLWTSPNHLAFISIFGHYIDHKKNTKSRLLAFRRQPGQHYGQNIAVTVNEVIQGWGFRHKVGVAVCDNASSSDTCIQALPLWNPGPPDNPR